MPLTVDENELSPILLGLTGSSGLTNNTTNVVVVDSPINTTSIRQIDRQQFSVKNLDVTLATIIASIYDSSGIRTIERVIMNPGDKWVNDTNVILPVSGSKLLLRLNGNVNTNQLSWTVTYNEIDKGTIS